MPSDEKITALDELTSLASADEFAIIDDTTGTPTTKRVSLDNVDDFFSATTKTLTNKTLTSAVLTTPQINDTTTDHQYIFGVSELTADRTVTMPLLTGNDTFVFNDFTATMTNKTLTSPTINTATIAGATTLSGVLTASAAINITTADEGNDIPLTVTQNDVTNNPHAVTVTNAGTGRGVNIVQSGVLASDGAGLLVYSNAAQVTTGRGLAQIYQDHASSTTTVLSVKNDGTGNGLLIDQNGNGEALSVDNAGTNNALNISQTGVLASGDHGIRLYSNAAQINASLLDVNSDNASSTFNVATINNDGSGYGLSIAGTGGGLNVEEGFLNVGASRNTLTISGGEITVTGTIHAVLGEGAAADNLDTINGGSAWEGDFLFLRQGDNAQDITIRGYSVGGGNIYMDSSWSDTTTMLNIRSVAMFVRIGGAWLLLAVNR